MDLKQLTELNAPSGHEQAMRRALLSELEQLPGVETSIDRMGNVIAVKACGIPGAKRVMVAAHMDEVGFIVRSITQEGYLRVSPVGGVDPRVIISKRVTVGDERVPGVIGAMAIHLQSAADRANVLGYDDVYVDIGAASHEEAEAKAPVGTYVSFDTDYVAFGDGYISAKALDDRVGVYNLLRLLQGDYPCDLIAAFTSEEEVGCRGAKGAAFAQAPDLGIVLEGTTCNDMGHVPEPLQVCAAGQGCTVSFMDGSTIVSRGLYRKALELAEAQGIPCQVKHAVAGGNDAGYIQRAREGVPTIVLSVPCRSIHSPSGVCRMSDVEAQRDLAAALLRAVND